MGVGQQVGQIGGSGNWAAFFFVFAYVKLFIGLVNLLPLPPFDGGHLADPPDREGPRAAGSTCAG